MCVGLDELRVSLDAVTPELYQHLRGIDKLPQIIANLHAFVARHGGREQPRVSLWMVGMQENLHEMPDFVRMAADIGVPEDCTCSAWSTLAMARSSTSAPR